MDSPSPLWYRELSKLGLERQWNFNDDPGILIDLISAVVEKLGGKDRLDV